MKVKNYQELIVWQKAMDLVEHVYTDLARQRINLFTGKFSRRPLPTAHRPLIARDSN